MITPSGRGGAERKRAARSRSSRALTSFASRKITSLNPTFAYLEARFAGASGPPLSRPMSGIHGIAALDRLNIGGLRCQ